MGRAELRRQKKAEQKAQKTYTFTAEQLEALKKRITEEAMAKAHELTCKEIEEIKKEVSEEAIGRALSLMFAIPLKVLITDYWPKTAKKRGPEFTSKVLDLYYQWENDEVDINDLLDDLWEYGDIKFKYQDPN